MLLLLKIDGPARPLPAVVCGPDGKWLEWEDKRFDIVGRGSIADEVVDIVEAQLHGTRGAADTKTTEDSAVAAGEPMLERGSGAAPPLPPVGRPADPVAVRASDARGGGLTMGIETELPGADISTAMGPVFDFGSSVGPLLLGGREAFRVTVPNDKLLFMDFEAAVSYGAPLNPDKLLGATLRFGAEWMIAYPEGNSGQAAVVPVAELGVRVGHSFGLVGLWFGLDARFRLAKLHLLEGDNIYANDVGGSFTLGASLVDWSRK